MTDADLVRGARRGDAEAWRTLYARYLPMVWRQAYALIADVHAAEDITSETMLALLRSIDRLDIEEPKIGGWLRTVVRRRVADHQRKLIRGRDAMVATGEAAARNGQASPAPSAPLEAKETRNHVMRVLDALSERQRTVLEWKYLESLGVREMAERLGETEKAVESLLYRARREFRRLFEVDSLRREPVISASHLNGETNSQAK